MCNVIIWSQESVHEDEIDKEEVGMDKADRNKVNMCVSQVRREKTGIEIEF